MPSGRKAQETTNSIEVGRAAAIGGTCSNCRPANGPAAERSPSALGSSSEGTAVGCVAKVNVIFFSDSAAKTYSSNDLTLAELRERGKGTEFDLTAVERNEADVSNRSSHGSDLP